MIEIRTLCPLLTTYCKLIVILLTSAIIHTCSRCDSYSFLWHDGQNWAERDHTLCTPITITPAVPQTGCWVRIAPLINTSREETHHAPPCTSVTQSAAPYKGKMQVRRHRLCEARMKQSQWVRYFALCILYCWGWCKTWIDAVYVW